MLALLQLLLVGHVHIWKEDDRFPLIGEGFDGSRGPIGYVVYCKCEKCGAPKRFRLA